MSVHDFSRQRSNPRRPPFQMMVWRYRSGEARAVIFFDVGCGELLQGRYVMADTPEEPDGTLCLVQADEDDPGRLQLHDMFSRRIYEVPGPGVEIWASVYACLEVYRPMAA